MQTIIVQSNIHNIWLAGDLNADFSRNTRFTRLVHDYLAEIGLTLLWENADQLENVSKPSYTYMSTTTGRACFSTIDHFACSLRLFPLISEAGAIHSGENTSNHSAIYAKLNIGAIDISEEKIAASKHIDWSVATEDAKTEYHRRLTEQLDYFDTPDCALCTDVHCSAHEHDMEQYTMGILETIQAVARETLPVKGGGDTSKYRKCTPGWSEFVQPYLEESRF